MISRSTIAKIALAAGAAATLSALVPAAASAQGYYGQPSYDARSGAYYDPCQRDTANRSVGGGLAGAVAGAVIGGNVASRHVRDEGAILGGVLGAVVGSQIGRSTAACSPQNRQYGYNTGYQQSPYGQPYYGQGYDARPYDYGYNARPAPRRYDRRYDDRRYDDYTYNDSYSSSSSYGAADCRMVESTIRMPDGRRQTRMAQACRDSRGEYQLVD